MEQADSPETPGFVQQVTSPPLSEQEQCLALLKQVLASRAFARSARLSNFLEFVCMREIDGRAQEINEQQIGIHVFGRSPTYSSADDSIVRSQARLLRLRLDDYFEHECPASLWRITIPKGAYIPVFEPRVQEQTTLPAVVAQDFPRTYDLAAEQLPLPGKPSASMRQHWPVLMISALALLILLSFVLVLRGSLQTRQKHESQAAQLLWRSIFLSGRSVVIVPSDDALVLFQEFTHAPVPLNDYLSGSYLAHQLPAGTALTLGAAWFTTHQYTSTADLNLSMRLARLPEAADVDLVTRNARVLRLDDMKRSNVILIGGVGSNPWVSLFASRLNFDVNYDWKQSQGYVLNKHPEAGEAGLYQELMHDGARENYGVLAYLPGISGNGSTLLFEGTDMAGTEAAADFPFNNHAFAAFAKQIGGGAASGTSLPFFEALLQTTEVAGNAPESHVIAFRIIHP